MVEFAIVFVILMIIFGGIIDVGRSIYMYMNINLLAQESARLGSLGHDDEYLLTYIEDNFKLGDYADVVVAINPDDELRESGDNLKIEIEYEINYFMPGVGYVLPESIGSDATIRVE